MTILCYHSVDPCWTSPLAVTPEEFERQCAWLARHRTVVPLDVALDRMDAQGLLPRGMVALTFDDGFLELRDNVFPTLEKHALPATTFLVAATLTTEGHPVDWVDTAPTWELQTLAPDHVLEAQERGFDFASHSWTHRTLPALEADDCLEDLRESRVFLEDLLKQPVPYLAYPRGKHDAMVRRATERAGYSHGLALPEGPEDPGPYAVPRAGVFPGNNDHVLRAKTSRRYQAFRQSKVYPAIRSALRRGA